VFDDKHKTPYVRSVIKITEIVATYGFLGQVLYSQTEIDFPMDMRHYRLATPEEIARDVSARLLK
jgi:hypothetical protein